MLAQNTELISKLIFSKSAFGRVTGCKVGQIESFEVGTEVRAQVKGQIVIATAKQMLDQFIAFRKSGAEGLQSQPVFSGVYEVYNPKKGSGWKVTTKKGVSCECPDYAEVKKAFGTGVCKHCYRVLQDLGWGSLQEYLGQKPQLRLVPARKPVRLEDMKMQQLKDLAKEIGIGRPAGDKRFKKTWIEAIAAAQQPTADLDLLSAA